MKVILPLCLLAACIRPADERARSDEEVGRESAGGVDFEVDGGHVRRIESGELLLWAQQPALELRAASDAQPASPWTLEIENCMPGAEASATDGDGAPVEVTALSAPRPTACRFRFEIPPSAERTLQIAPPDREVLEPYAFAFMADIQTALPRVDDVFARINQDPELRFVVSAGDLVESATREEYELLLAKLEVLEVPYFSTIGNHELDGNVDLWREFFGRYSIHFEFKGAAFSFVDSGNASLDPLVYDRLDGWLAAAEDRVHVFGTHYPPFDPIGVRSASFRSRSEAAKLLARLAAGGVDLTLYGHIHSYYAYSNAGIPSFISGGGGAISEKLDGVARHFLKVEVDPEAGEVLDVALVRVD